MGRFVNPDNSAFQVALNATWDMDADAVAKGVEKIHLK